MRRTRKASFPRGVSISGVLAKSLTTRTLLAKISVTSTSSPRPAVAKLNYVSVLMKAAFAHEMSRPSVWQPSRRKQPLAAGKLATKALASRQSSARRVAHRCGSEADLYYQSPELTPAYTMPYYRYTLVTCILYWMHAPKPKEASDA
jgi:hypothetical protein